LLLHPPQLLTGEHHSRHRSGRDHAPSSARGCRLHKGVHGGQLPGASWEQTAHVGREREVSHRSEDPPSAGGVPRRAGDPAMDVGVEGGDTGVRLNHHASD
jgi:hypothetical protein